jgi:Flp pilus assembly protein TadD
MTVEEAIHLALQLHQDGKLDEAEALYRRILVSQPKYPDALNLLGALQHQKGRHRDAVELFGQAIDLAPSTAVFHFNLGMALAADHRPEQAAAAYRQSLRLNPDDASVHFSLGTLLQSQDDLPAAIASLRTAVKLSPQNPEAWNALGLALADAGKSDDALIPLRRGIELKPDYAEAHLNLGVTLLRLGDFQNGWPEYEWRWRIPHLYVSPLKFPTPPWEGEELHGKRIVLHAEQGFGDTIQFIRFAPLVAQRGGKVVYFGPPESFRVLQTAAGIDECVDWNKSLTYDAHCPLLSLPRIFKADLNNIPANVPYLSAEPELIRAWQQRLPKDGRLKVGLNWAGRPEHARDRHRSIPLAQLAPLWSVPSVHFISLQIGAAAKQIQTARLEIADRSNDLKDLADTAALVANLDLVICIDSAVAHLSGALAKPTWVFLPHAPDWRWMHDRSDSPWYPTMRLFRQKSAGDWQSPIEQVVQALNALS